MRLSIVLCTYNGERFLREQLDSYLAQTRLPDEIVIADDASTDATWPMLEAFAGRARERGIAILASRNPRNLGYVRNFSEALPRAGGDLLFLSDQDDVWHPEKLQRMAGEFERRPQLGLLHTDARLIDADGADLGCSLFAALELTAAEIDAEHRGDAFHVLLRRNTATGATLALRRGLLPSPMRVPPRWIHDEWLAMAVACRAQVDCLEWASIDYRQHGGNQIGATPRTLAQKLAGSGRPGKREYMRRVAGGMRELLAHAQGGMLDMSEARVRDLQARIAHAELRASLEPRFWKRWPQVAMEVRSGRYRAYSAGLRSIASDLLGRE
jgi:glycosyltransferase involved in cell wall biosynthesis